MNWVTSCASGMARVRTEKSETQEIRLRRRPKRSVSGPMVTAPMPTPTRPMVEAVVAVAGVKPRAPVSSRVGITAPITTRSKPSRATATQQSRTGQKPAARGVVPVAWTGGADGGHRRLLTGMRRLSLRPPCQLVATNRPVDASAQWKSGGDAARARTPYLRSVTEPPRAPPTRRSRPRPRSSAEIAAVAAGAAWRASRSRASTTRRTAPACCGTRPRTCSHADPEGIELWSPVFGSSESTRSRPT